MKLAALLTQHGPRQDVLVCVCLKAYHCLPQHLQQKLHDGGFPDHCLPGLQ